MISVAVQRGNYTYVYNEKNSIISSSYGELHGYTSTTYSVKKGSYVYTYNEKGSLISSMFVGNKK